MADTPTPHADAPQVKACPFCGDMPEILPAAMSRYGRNGYTIRCRGCCIERTVRTLRHTLEWAHDNLIEKWNGRVDTNIGKIEEATRWISMAHHHDRCAHRAGGVCDCGKFAVLTALRS